MASDHRVLAIAAFKPEDLELEPWDLTCWDLAYTKPGSQNPETS